MCRSGVLRYVVIGQSKIKQTLRIDPKSFDEYLHREETAKELAAIEDKIADEALARHRPKRRAASRTASTSSTK